MSRFLAELKQCFKIIAGLVVVETRLTAISSERLFRYFTVSVLHFAAQSESTECATRNVK